MRFITGKHSARRRCPFLPRQKHALHTKWNRPKSTRFFSASCHVHFIIMWKSSLASPLLFISTLFHPLTATIREAKTSSETLRIFHCCASHPSTKKNSRQCLSLILRRKKKSSLESADMYVVDVREEKTRQLWTFSRFVAEEHVRRLARFVGDGAPISTV